MANIQILANAKVLKCPIKAGLSSSDTKNTVIVYGKPPELPAPKVSLTEIAQEFGEVFNLKDIKLPGNIGESITFSLRQAYFKKVSEKSVDNTPVVDSGQAKNGADYALWLELYADKLTEGWPIEVSSVSIKVWNTNSALVLKDMEITAMQALLDEVS